MGNKVSSALEFRLYEPKDSLGEFVDLAYEALQESEYKEFVSEMDIEKAIEYYGRVCARADSQRAAFVASEGTKLIGIMVVLYSFVPWSNLGLAIEELWYVKKHPKRVRAYRGLLNAFEEWAEHLGCRAVWVGCYNERFQEHLKKDGYQYKNTLMGKNL